MLTPAKPAAVLASAVSAEATPTGPPVVRRPDDNVDIEIIDAEQVLATADLELEPDERQARATLQHHLNYMLQLQEGFGLQTPEWMVNATAADVEAAKLKLRSMRPPGQKLEGLRGVVARGEKRLANAQARLEAAELEVIDARAGHAEESLRLEEHRAEMQALVSDLASTAQVFQVDSPAQLPPEIASLNQQIASLNQQLCNQAMVAQQQLELLEVHARQALGVKQVQLNKLIEALTAAGMHQLVDAADPMHVTPMQIAACMAEASIDAVQDTLVMDAALTTAPFIVPTPGGRILLSSGKVAAGLIKGKQLVLTPTDGSGLAAETTAMVRAQESSPYGAR